MLSALLPIKISNIVSSPFPVNLVQTIPIAKPAQNLPSDIEAEEMWMWLASDSFAATIGKINQDSNAPSYAKVWANDTQTIGPTPLALHFNKITSLLNELAQRRAAATTTGSTGATTGTTTTTNTSGTTATTGSSTGSGVSTGAIVAGIAAVAAIGGGIWWYTSHRKKPTKVASKKSTLSSRETVQSRTLPSSREMRRSRRSMHRALPSIREMQRAV